MIQQFEKLFKETHEEDAETGQFINIDTHGYIAEYNQAIKDVINVFKKHQVLIWSNEHNGWWRPMKCGYTSFKELAGYYNLDEAIEICKNANKYISYNKQDIDTVIIKPNETIVFE